MGTSQQMDVGSTKIKRFSSLYSKGAPEKIVSVDEKWKSKGPVRNNSIKYFNTHQRLFIPANNVDPEKEEGCMNKIKIERSLKLREEDFKNRPKYDIVSGRPSDDSAWINSFGKQARNIGIRTEMDVRKDEVANRDHWAKVLNMK